MWIDFVTAFPSWFEGPMTQSIVGRAVKAGLVTIHRHDLRDFTDDAHRTVDDHPYGGGGGMVLKAEPMFRCIESILGIPALEGDRHVRDFLPPDTEVIAPAPQGDRLVQSVAVELSLKRRLIFLCGHYKGIDERVHEKLVTRFVSIGDYVLTGGELAAMVITDAMIRLIPGAIGDAQSALTDSFQEGLLDCAYYTRPEDFRGMRVPDVLLSGDHRKIDEWRTQQRLDVTRRLRPDLTNPQEELQMVNRMKKEQKN